MKNVYTATMSLFCCLLFLFMPDISGTYSYESSVSGKVTNTFKATRPVIVDPNTYVMSGLLAGDEYSAFSLSDTTDIINKKYLLGTAGLFSVFLKNNFQTYNADAEGRLAIGGSAHISTPYDTYQVGCGYDRYGEDAHDGTAHIIVQGREAGNISSAFAFVSGNKPYESREYEGDWFGNYMHPKTALFSADTDIWINNYGLLDENSVQYADTLRNGIWEPHNVMETASIYRMNEGEKIINFDVQFELLRSRSIMLADKYTENAEVLYDNQNIFFSYSGNDIPGVIYFNVASEKINMLSSSVFYFDVPDTSYVIINIPGYSVNTSTNNIAYYKDASGDYRQFKNNDIAAGKYLYNMYESVSLNIGNSVHGSVLAPNADVNGNYGHISGTLAALSFQGTSEFGYPSCYIPADIMENDGYDADENIVLTKKAESLGKLDVTQDGGAWVKLERTDNENGDYIIDLSGYDNVIRSIAVTVEDANQWFYFDMYVNAGKAQQGKMDNAVDNVITVSGNWWNQPSKNDIIRFQTKNLWDGYIGIGDITKVEITLDNMTVLTATYVNNTKGYEFTEDVKATASGKYSDINNGVIYKVTIKNADVRGRSITDTLPDGIEFLKITDGNDLVTADVSENTIRLTFRPSAPVNEEISISYLCLINTTVTEDTLINTVTFRKKEAQAIITHDSDEYAELHDKKYVDDSKTEIPTAENILLYK